VLLIESRIVEAVHVLSALRLSVDPPIVSVREGGTQSVETSVVAGMSPNSVA
jgi:hypothetical protein